MNYSDVFKYNSILYRHNFSNSFNNNLAINDNVYKYFYTLIFTMRKLLYFSFLFLFSNLYSQKPIVTGKIIEKSTNLPLANASVIFFNTETKKTAVTTTDIDGKYKTEVLSGVYDIKYQFISFKTKISEKVFINENKNLETIYLDDESQKLEAVEIRVEKTSIDIKLDKKIYNVGKDILVKGGTVSDLLDNVPSIAVSSEGTVSLRGNENVRILIDGKPSSAINVADALKLIPADAVDKVEVITNPSARYDAEGGGGIINIVLKKGKNQGFNGTFNISVGEPENTTASANLNLKKEYFNLFSNVGYNKKKNPGNFLINQENLNPDRSLKSYLEERRDSRRFGEGANLSLGLELLIDKNTSWTNALSFRQNDGGNNEDVFYFNYNNTRSFVNTIQRITNLTSFNENVEYTTNFTKKFKKEGHKLNFDGAFSQEIENEFSFIEGSIVQNNNFISSERTKKDNQQNRNLLQLDYVYPISKNTQIEAGFRGNYVDLVTDFRVEEKLTQTSPFTNIVGFTNKLEYIENVNATYLQFGSKIKKLSYLVGLRFEDSNIQVNQLTSGIFMNKNYSNFFPSAFLTYELSNNTNLSLNYSKRITRPRDRFINPFASYTSNINLFQGNPDINPALSDAFDLGFLKKWDKITLSTSAYYNYTKNSFQIVRKERGDLINGIPVIVNTPFNLATDAKSGFEFTLNYNFKKWWKLNGNFNFFNNKTTGEYSYINTNNNVVIQNFDFNANTWFTRLTSKITLPYKIDWQTNITYNADQKTRQGRSVGVPGANTGFSKDILKDMGTISFNISDFFNTRKRIQDINLPNVNSYSEMQMRVRQFTLNFTYRFNKKKSEEKPVKRQNEGGDEPMG